MWLPKNGRNVAIILASIVNTCDSIQSLKRLHAFAIVTGLLRHPVVFAKIFRFAAVSPRGDLSYAHQLFDQIPNPRSFFYNTLIRAHSKTSSPSHSLRLFNRMRLARVDPDEFTLTFLLKSRARKTTMTVAMRRSSSLPSDPSYADEIHGLALKLGFCLHLHVCNALIHVYGSRGMPAAAEQLFSEIASSAGVVDAVSWSGLLNAYARAGEIDRARQVFDKIPEKDRDVVSWTAMISGYSRANRPKQALEIFLAMLASGERPDEVTMLSVVSACRNSRDLETGIEAHKSIDRAGFGWMVSLRNALIDMYAKCGALERASKLFEESGRKDLITWNTIISAHANHGDVEVALGSFRRMIGLGVSPDKFTLLAILVGFSLKGAVDEGIRLLESMERDYGVEACLEHYGCVVDMLLKRGRLDESFRLIERASILSRGGTASLWESLVAACRRFGDAEMEKQAVRRLQELRPGGEYNLLLRDTCFSDV